MSPIHCPISDDLVACGGGELSFSFSSSSTSSSSSSSFPDTSFSLLLSVVLDDAVFCFLDLGWPSGDSSSLSRGCFGPEASVVVVFLVGSLS